MQLLLEATANTMADPNKDLFGDSDEDDEQPQQASAAADKLKKLQELAQKKRKKQVGPPFGS